jgi:hypothetical protein
MYGEQKGGVRAMVTGSILLTVVSFLFGIFGITTIWPAFANMVFEWFSKH